MTSGRAFLGLSWVGLAALAAVSCAAAPPAQPAAQQPPDTVRGRAGPFAAAAVTLRRTGPAEGGGFAAVLDTGTGKRWPLPGPDDPPDFFIVAPRAVMFTPVDGTGSNGVIILYNSSQIGPGNGTDHRALAYRVTAGGVTRLPAVEARLDGAADARTARARLARR